MKLLFALSTFALIAFTTLAQAQVQLPLCGEKIKYEVLVNTNTHEKILKKTGVSCLHPMQDCRQIQQMHDQNGVQYSDQIGQVTYLNEHERRNFEGTTYECGSTMSMTSFPKLKN